MIMNSTSQEQFNEAMNGVPKMVDPIAPTNVVPRDADTLGGLYRAEDITEIKENLEGITIHRKKVNIEVNAGGVGFLGVAGFNNKDANIPFACYTINGVAIGSPTWGTIDNQWYIYSDTYKGKPLEVHVLYVRNVVDD